MELVGHRAQALGQQADAAGVDGQLAGARLEQVAFDGNDVAQVPVLEAVVDLFAHIVLGDVGLDAPGGVLQRGKAGLAHDALEHHAASHLDLDLGDAFAVEGFGIGSAVYIVQLLRVVLRLEVVGKGHAFALSLGLAQGFEFFAALGNQLVFVLLGRGWGSGGVGHGLVFARVPHRSWLRAGPKPSILPGRLGIMRGCC